MKKINLKTMILIIAALAIIMSCFIISALANENDANDAMIEINVNEKLNASLIKKMRLENDGNTQMFYMKNAVAIISSFGGAPVVIRL